MLYVTWHFSQWKIRWPGGGETGSKYKGKQGSLGIVLVAAATNGSQICFSHQLSQLSMPTQDLGNSAPIAVPG